MGCLLVALVSPPALSEAPGGSTRDPELGVEIRELEPALEELCPIVDDIKLKPKPNGTIGVRIIGKADTKCFDKREYVLVREKNETLLIPRFSKSNPLKKCKENKWDPFSEDAAELALTDPASAHLKVLGYKGWYSVEVPQKFFENISPNEYGPLPPTTNDIKLEK